MLLSLLLPLGYNACLEAAQASTRKEGLIQAVLLTRMNLMIPLLLPAAQKVGAGRIGPEAQVGVVSLAVALTSRQAWQALQANSLPDILQAVVSHPAVSALGFDFLISLASSAIWILQPAEPAGKS